VFFSHSGLNLKTHGFQVQRSRNQDCVQTNESWKLKNLI
jgi:hypothetical protein